MEEFQIQNIDPSIYINQEYNSDDINLLKSININKEFGRENDTIEMHIISPSGDILLSNYNYTSYRSINNVNNTSLFNNIELDPEKDILSYGYSRGQFDIIYNFYRHLFDSSNNNEFYIKEISRDRTEIKITSNNILYNDLQNLFVEYIINRNQRNFYSDFILNFGGNQTIIGVNIALDNVNTTTPSLYIKLYEPLSTSYDLKTLLWIEEAISEPYSFRLNNEVFIENISNSIPLKGPNFDIQINEQISSNTQYLNISSVLDNNMTSSYNQLQYLIKDNIQINIDYNDYSNFIHFSSIQNRIENFIYKLNQIQKLEGDLNILNNLSSSVDTGSINNSILTLKSQINNITQNFDGYEYFLYYESGSNSFPKINSFKPYINENTTSSISLEWIGSDDYESNYYGGKILDASNFDNQNRDNLWNNLPEYIKYDPQNSQLELVISMLGQHYDYIWTYIKDINNKNDNDNRLNFGISKDLIAETLKSFGIKLYTNSRNNENIYSALLGINPDGSFLPSTGSYKISNYITASNYTIPESDIVKETYKRLYNNLPLLLKARGTERGLRALINCFGISDTILNIKEFGGIIKEQDFIEQNINKFNYSLNFNQSSSLQIPFYPSNQQYINTGFDNINPDTIEFRFKFNGTLSTQSLLISDNNDKQIRVVYNTGSYANIDFGLNGDEGWIYSDPINLPLYNDNWWTINLTRSSGSIRNTDSSSNQNYILNIGSKNQTGIEYLESSSIYINGTISSSYNRTWLSNSTNILGGNNFSGSIQEFRYWIGSIPFENFKDHILNPKSFSYNNPTSSYNSLIFRLPLGSELDNKITGSLISVHPSNIESFISNSINSSLAIINNYQYSSYDDNYELYLVNSPNGGNFIESNNKIKIVDNITIPDNTLSPFVSIIKKNQYNQVKNSSNIEIGISPQNSINDDIIKQLGNFNIDDYIGNPADYNKRSYPDLDKLRSFYFKKYTQEGSLIDIIKLLSYFDNSLFKMVKDFVPAKGNLSSGLIIKPTLLEKNKIQKFEPSLSIEYRECEIDTAFITGSNPLDTNIIVKYDEIIPSSIGYITKVHEDQEEWINGELPGGNLLVHTQSLENQIYENNKINPSNLDENVDYSRILLNPILNNVEDARTSNKYFDVDYFSNINLPSNINYITASLIGNTYNPIIFADVQDSNYSLQRNIRPRYLGSKNISKLYNKYTAGDKSYGKTAAIDKNSTKFAYFQEITSQSYTLPGRTNSYIKYLIDENSNITELTRQNKNLFDVQSIFNIEEADIILDDNQSPSKQQLDGLNNIFAGGFRYEPILQNIVGTHKYLEYTYTNDLVIPNTGGSGSVIQELDPNSLLITGNPILNNPLLYSPLNTLNEDNIKLSLNSTLSIPIQRNTGDNREIVQRISGSFELISYISPPTNKVTELYQNNNYEGTMWGIYGSIETGECNYYVDPTTGTDLRGTNDNVRSVKVPAGVILELWGSAYFTGPYKNIVGPASVSQAGLFDCPLCGSGNGVTSVRTTIVSCSVSVNVYNSYNSLSTTLPENELLIFNGTTYNSSSISNSSPSIDLSKTNEIGVKIKFNIDGYVVLPANQNNATVLIRDLSFQPGLLKSDVVYNNTSLNSRIQFTTIPTLNSNNVYKFNSPFVFGSPPSYLYITGALDNGFDSGSESNYYFERGTYNNSTTYNLLTASYDLSNIFYNQIVQGNTFTQTFPIFFNLGYEDVSSIFNLKTGDLLRFYNHDKGEFPQNFEREVITIIPPSNPPTLSFIDGTNRLFILVDDNIPNQSCVDNFNEIPSNIQNFIFLSKIPDETNIILNTPKKNGKTSPGLILPGNISKSIKDKAGNIIKQLKNQQLI